MRPQQHRHPAAIAAADTGQSAPFVPAGHRLAHEQLSDAFEQTRPVAILIGQGNSGASHVIGRFLAELEDEVDVARVTGPRTSAIDGMRDVIRAIGFDPTDMSLANLESVLKMFLSFQRTHQRRTIICFEEVQDSGWWMLDLIRQLVELESSDKYGLMVIISGHPSLNKLLNEFPLSAINEIVKQRINLAPFTLQETTEYVRRRVESAGTVAIGDVFEFHAISLLHELSKGLPDSVSRICTKCLEMLDDDDAAPVSKAMVRKASQLQQSANDTNGTAAAGAMQRQKKALRRGGQLIARSGGKVTQEQKIGRGHVLIGRDEACDVRFNSKSVSRYHALVVNAPNSVKIVDLGSTNGIVVNGRGVSQHVLKDGDVVTIGDCAIEYLVGRKPETLVFDTERTDTFEPQDLLPDLSGTDSAVAEPTGKDFATAGGPEGRRARH